MGRFLFLSLFISYLSIVRIGAPPVDQKKPNESQDGPVGPDDPAFYNLEYERYLQEVVQVLESDPEFRAKLEKANPDDVKSGKIAEELDFLHHDVRSKLNEIKRREIDRLRQALREQMERENGVHNLVMPSHLDHENLETFEKDDLKKLIHKTTRDLEEIDAKRRQEYKEYEMEKELEFREKLANMTEEERQNATKQREDAEKRHKKHPDVKHPGSKAQLEEVWEEVDKLPKENFDPRTFFQLHDLSGDGVLDIAELEALFQKELDKVYDKNNPDDDMRERDEEMARMREHVMKEIDSNKDGMISLDEFLTDAKKPDFTEDEGWNTLDQQKKVYSEDDLKLFAAQWAKDHGVPLDKLYGGYGQQYPGQYPPGQYPQYQQQQPYYGQYPNQPYPNPGYPNQQQFQQQQQLGPGQGQFQVPGQQGQYQPQVGQGQAQSQGQPPYQQGQPQFQQGQQPGQPQSQAQPHAQYQQQQMPQQPYQPGQGGQPIGQQPVQPVGQQQQQAPVGQVYQQQAGGQQPQAQVVPQQVPAGGAPVQQPQGQQPRP